LAKDFSLDSLVWTQLEQKEVNLRKNFGCTVFSDHLLVLKQIGGGLMFKSTTLYCWNISFLIVLSLLSFLLEANAWSNFDVRDSEVTGRRNFVVYKNLLVTSGLKDMSGEVAISILNVDRKNYSLKIIVYNFNRYWDLASRIT